MIFEQNLSGILKSSRTHGRHLLFKILCRRMKSNEPVSPNLTKSISVELWQSYEQSYAKLSFVPVMSAHNEACVRESDSDDMQMLSGSLIDKLVVRSQFLATYVAIYYKNT